MSNANCNNCIYRCSCQGVRKARTANSGYCFDYERESRLTDHWYAILVMAFMLALVGMGMATVLQLSLWILEGGCSK